MTTLLPLDMSMWAGSEAKGGQVKVAEGYRGDGGECGILTSHKYFSTCT